MATASALDSLLETLSRCFDTESAQRLLDFHIDPTVHERVEVLATGANEGTLNPEERNEYEPLISAAEFISILKLKARRQLRKILSSNRALLSSYIRIQPIGM